MVTIKIKYYLLYGSLIRLFGLACFYIFGQMIKTLNCYYYPQEYNELVV